MNAAQVVSEFSERVRFRVYGSESWDVIGPFALPKFYMLSCYVIGCPWVVNMVVGGCMEF